VCDPCGGTAARGGLSTCWPHPRESANPRWSWIDVGNAQHVSTRICPETRGRQLTEAAAIGAAAGLVGVAAMTLAEQAEQKLTGRADSFVPARALLTLLGRRPGPAEQPVVWNHAMHWGTGALLGALRGVWSSVGIRGPLADVWHTSVRLAFDQTVENATGVGAPPQDWPAREQVVDVLHKTVYSTVTGVVADRWIPPVLASRRGSASH
jgi:hypothetical protein